MNREVRLSREWATVESVLSQHVCCTVHSSESQADEHPVPYLQRQRKRREREKVTEKHSLERDLQRETQRTHPCSCNTTFGVPKPSSYFPLPYILEMYYMIISLLLYLLESIMHLLNLEVVFFYYQCLFFYTNKCKWLIHLLKEPLFSVFWTCAKKGIENYKAWPTFEPNAVMRSVPILHFMIKVILPLIQLSIIPMQMNLPVSNQSWWSNCAPHMIAYDGWLLPLHRPPRQIQIQRRYSCVHTHRYAHIFPSTGKGIPLNVIIKSVFLSVLTHTMVVLHTHTHTNSLHAWKCATQQTWSAMNTLPVSHTQADTPNNTLTWGTDIWTCRNSQCILDLKADIRIKKDVYLTIASSHAGLLPYCPGEIGRASCRERV